MPPAPRTRLRLPKVCCLPHKTQPHRFFPVLRSRFFLRTLVIRCWHLLLAAKALLLLRASISSRHSHQAGWALFLFFLSRKISLFLSASAVFFGSSSISVFPPRAGEVSVGTGGFSDTATGTAWVDRILAVPAPSPSFAHRPLVISGNSWPDPGSGTPVRHTHAATACKLDEDGMLAETVDTDSVHSQLYYGSPPSFYLRDSINARPPLVSHNSSPGRRKPASTLLAQSAPSTEDCATLRARRMQLLDVVKQLGENVRRSQVAASSPLAAPFAVPSSIALFSGREPPVASPSFSAGTSTAEVDSSLTQDNQSFIQDDQSLLPDNQTVYQDAQSSLLEVRSSLPDNQILRQDARLLLPAGAQSPLAVASLGTRRDNQFLLQDDQTHQPTGVQSPSSGASSGTFQDDQTLLQDDQSPRLAGAQSSGIGLLQDICSVLQDVISPGVQAPSSGAPFGTLQDDQTLLQDDQSPRLAEAQPSGLEVIQDICNVLQDVISSPHVGRSTASAGPSAQTITFAGLPTKLAPGVVPLPHSRTSAPPEAPPSSWLPMAYKDEDLAAEALYLEYTHYTERLPALYQASGMVPPACCFLSFREYHALPSSWRLSKHSETGSGSPRDLHIVTIMAYLDRTEPFRLAHGFGPPRPRFSSSVGFSREPALPPRAQDLTARTPGLSSSPFVNAASSQVGLLPSGLTPLSHLWCLPLCLDPFTLAAPAALSPITSHPLASTFTNRLCTCSSSRTPVSSQQVSRFSLSFPFERMQPSITHPISLWCLSLRVDPCVLATLPCTHHGTSLTLACRPPGYLPPCLLPSGLPPSYTYCDDASLTPTSPLLQSLSSTEDFHRGARTENFHVPTPDADCDRPCLPTTLQSAHRVGSFFPPAKTHSPMQSLPMVLCPYLAGDYLLLTLSSHTRLPYSLPPSLLPWLSLGSGQVVQSLPSPLFPGLWC